MKATLFTEYTAQEEWRLDDNDVKNLIAYLKSDKSWLPHRFKDNTEEEIISELEDNSDEYGDEIRSWLYDNMYEPRKEHCGEEGNYFEFESKRL